MHAEFLLMVALAWALESTAQLGIHVVGIPVALRIVILEQASASKRLLLSEQVVLLVWIGLLAISDLPARRLDSY